MVDVVGSGGSGGLFFSRGSSGGEWRLDRVTFTWPSEEWLSILRWRLIWRTISFRWYFSIADPRGGDIGRPEMRAADDDEDDVDAAAAPRWYCKERDEDDFGGGERGPPRPRCKESDL